MLGTGTPDPWAPPAAGPAVDGGCGAKSVGVVNCGIEELLPRWLSYCCATRAICWWLSWACTYWSTKAVIVAEGPTHVLDGLAVMAFARSDGVGCAIGAGMAARA